MNTEATCTFAEMVPLFQELFEPEPARLTAMIGRMKNFLRLNACGGVDRSQGKTSHFTGRDVWELVVLMELTTLGFPPMRAIELQKLFALKKWDEHFIIDGRARLDLGITPLRAAMVEHLPRFFMDQREKAVRPKALLKRNEQVNLGERDDVPVGAVYRII
jgi:hypothetical protein